MKILYFPIFSTLLFYKTTFICVHTLVSKRKRVDAIEKKIRKLEDEVRHHQYLYYVKNSPEISDLEFDKLFKELQNFEKEYPQYTSPNSPTQTVGSDLDNRFEKFTHKIPVLSLENTYNLSELNEWIQKTGKEYKYSIEWKIDGASIVLYYEKGELVKGITRGTGGIGDDVTENIRTIKNIPLKLKEPLTIYVRGEVYMGFQDFKKLNEKFDGKFANPRNLASGSIKYKNSNQVAKRPLKIFTYDGHIPDSKINQNSKILEIMKNNLLPVSEDIEFAKGEDVPKKIAEFQKKKETLDYPVDGLVIKLDDLSIRTKLGATSHSPRWARAFKFDAIMKETTIVDIDFAVGRTGKITPRAKVEPIQLAGTTVRYATLHNQDYINELRVGIGAKVKVAKRGEIIPAVEKVIEPGSSGIFQLPKKCPTCKTELVKVDDSVDIFCPNKKCPDRERNSLIFFCQKKQMDIEGLGEKQVALLYDKKFISSIIDLYELHKRKDELVELEGFGKKSVNIILKGIEDSKQKDFKVVLPSLGLREIGHKVTEILIENGFEDIDKIIQHTKGENSKEELLEIHGLGPRTVESLINNFKDKDVLNIIEKLKKAGLKFKTEIAKKPSFRPFEKQSWCVTGSFENFQPRDKAMEIITHYGGKKVSSVSSKTTHLLVGEAGGSKVKKAKELGIKIVDEKEFLGLLKEYNISI